MADARDIAYNILLDIESNNTFSNIAISKALRQNQFSEKTERAFITRLAEGVTEYRINLDYIINCFSKTKVNKCKPAIRCLLRMGTYQIMYMDSVPDSAACNESVKLAKKHGFSSLSGFVNGVLRNIARNKNDVKYLDKEKDIAAYLSVRYSMPEWLVKKILCDYPDNAETIIKASFTERETTIRVNTLKTDVDTLKEILKEKDIIVKNGKYCDKALIISNYDFVRKIPGYKQGLFTVQDESSMCSIMAAGINPGDTVVDVCAAPGGKTTAAAECLQGKGIVYSMDISEDKLELIEENVRRLGLENVKISAHDATEELLIDGQKVIADVVIADVPCSGMGIIGRKNDIKYHVSKEQLDDLVVLQRKIMTTVKQYVKSGGTLLYSTCTINPDENQNNVKWFIENNEEFVLEKERLFIQGIDECDGFYYAVIKNIK